MRRLLGIMLVISLMAIFGCTTERIYDCSKCDTDCSKCDVDCSDCKTDCSKCGPEVNLEPIKIKSGITMLTPPTCTDYLCGVTAVRGWASEVGVEVTTYDAAWAQAPVVLMYTEDSVGLLSYTTKLDFMKGVCEFTNSTDACDAADEELKNAQVQMKECLSNNGLSLDTIAFYYSDTCPYCAKMKPWVEELTGEGHNFYWVNYENQTSMDVAMACYGTILKLGEGVPQFACPSTGDWHIGAFLEKDDMIKYVQECEDAVGG